MDGTAKKKDRTQIVFVNKWELYYAKRFERRQFPKG